MKSMVDYENTAVTSKQSKEDSFFKFCKDNLLLVGSRAVGAGRGNSDYDFVLDMETWNKLEAHLNKEAFYFEHLPIYGEFQLYNRYNVKVFLKQINICVNLIVYGGDMSTIKETFSKINQMLRAAPKGLVQDKEFRCEIYNSVLKRLYDKPKPSASILENFSLF